MRLCREENILQSSAKACKKEWIKLNETAEKFQIKILNIMPGSLEHGTNEAKFARFNSSSWQFSFAKVRGYTPDP